LTAPQAGGIGLTMAGRLVVRILRVSHAGEQAAFPAGSALKSACRHYRLDFS